jgi:predicted Zn-dependent protease
MTMIRSKTGVWMRVVILAMLAVVAMGLLQGCETNPTTGRYQAVGLSLDEEVALGMQEKPKMIAEMGGEVARADLREYVTRVGSALASTVVQDDPRMAQVPWEFTLLDSDVINAFALPGGKVFMSRGLAQRMTNESQLAAVLGHEIGHVTARHTSERLGRGQWTGLGVGVVGAILGEPTMNDVLEQGAGLWLLGYSRSQELEADALGMRYMVRQGYNPIGTRQVMEILAKVDRNGAPPEFFSTHPHPESRIKQADMFLSTTYAATQNNSAYRTGEAEFQANFLKKLSLAYPAGREESTQVRAFAMSHGMCGPACGHGH